EVGVHVRRDGMEAVLAQIARDQSQMVRGTVRTHFRRHRVKEVQDEIGRKYSWINVIGNMQFLRAGWPAPQPKVETGSANGREQNGIGDTSTAERENDEVEQRRSRDEPRRPLLQNAPEAHRSKRGTHGDRKRRSEPDG